MIAKKKRGRPKKTTPIDDDKHSSNYSISDSISSSSCPLPPKKAKNYGKKNTLPPPSKKENIKIDIPLTDNGLIDIDKDVKITATIDY